MKQFDLYIHSICLTNRPAAFSSYKDVARNLHELRLRLKKIKALIRLTGSFAPQAAETVLRDVQTASRGLSELRDRDVVVAWVANKRINPSILRRPSRSSELSLQAQKWKKLPGVERKVKVFLHSIHPTAEDLEREFRRNWRKAGRLRRRAKRTHVDSDFHRWRRRMKDLHYQIEALKVVGLMVRKCHPRRIQQVATLLGDAHDRVIIEAYLKNGKKNTSSQATLQLHTEKKSLEKRALKIGAQLLRRPRNVAVLGGGKKNWPINRACKFS